MRLRQAQGVCGGGVSGRLGEKGRESGAAGIQEGGPGMYVGSVGTAGRVCMDLQLKWRDIKAAGGEHCEGGETAQVSAARGSVCAGHRESKEPRLK